MYLNEIFFKRETLEHMNFPPEYTKDLYNFPLEKSDKVQVFTFN